MIDKGVSVQIVKRILKYSFGRFLITGGISTGIDFIIYIFLSSYFDISIAKVISMIIASIFSFILNKTWTFSDIEKVNICKIIKYLFSQVVNIGTNVGINRLVYYIIQNKIIAFISATAVAMLINYILQKLLVFRRKK